MASGEGCIQGTPEVNPSAVKILIKCVRIYFVYGMTLKRQKGLKERIEALYGDQREDMSV